jgi:hypothetical protein
VRAESLTFREREKREMTFETSGRWPTEFDRTTNVVLHTIQAAGTTEKEIEQDQEFLCDLMMMVGRNDASRSMKDTIEAMDIAFIGLLVHRHLPYRDEETGEVTRPEQAKGSNYVFTMNVVVNMLIEHGLPKSVIENVASEGASKAMLNLRPPESFDNESLILHTHVVALFVIGMLIHRLMPTTSEHPLGE